jgi:hypothetical protein
MGAVAGECGEVGDTERRSGGPKLYFSVAELAQLTPWSEDAIRAMVARDTFRLGVHYFQPTRRRGQLVFRWDAVVARTASRRARAFRWLTEL